MVLPLKSGGRVGRRRGISLVRGNANPQIARMTRAAPWPGLRIAWSRIIHTPGGAGFQPAKDEHRMKSCATKGAVHCASHSGTARIIRLGALARFETSLAPDRQPHVARGRETTRPSSMRVRAAEPHQPGTLSFSCAGPPGAFRDLHERVGEPQTEQGEAGVIGPTPPHRG